MYFKSSFKGGVVAGMLATAISMVAVPAQAYIPEEFEHGFQLSRQSIAVAPTPSARPIHAPASPIANMHRATTMVTQVASRAPLGFQLFCLQNPTECRPDAERTLNYSPDLMRQISRVNLTVNRAIKARYDDSGDRWSVGGTTGDCEDFALTKRSELIKAGYPAGALRIATARTRSGSGHAVLIVRTSHGDFVLDNMTDAIKPWQQTGLEMLSISGADPQHWYAIG